MRITHLQVPFIRVESTLIGKIKMSKLCADK